jgi:hypothetical protein
VRGTVCVCLKTRIGLRASCERPVLHAGYQVLLRPRLSPVLLGVRRKPGSTRSGPQLARSVTALLRLTPSVALVRWQGGSTVHKILAFVAPKLIGGHDAPTPLGDLGLLEMTQAVQLADTTFELVGPDLLVSGYLPASGGLDAVAVAVAATPAEAQTPPSPTGDVLFYKAWDEFGALSNFSPHAVSISEGGAPHEWLTVEVRRFAA